MRFWQRVIIIFWNQLQRKRNSPKSKYHPREKNEAKVVISVPPPSSSSSPLNPNDQRSLFPPSPPLTYMSHFLLLKTKHVISPLGRPCVCFFCRLWPIQRVFSQGKQPNNFWGNLHVFCRHSTWEFQIEQLTNCWTWQARVVIFRILGQSRI